MTPPSIRLSVLGLNKGSFSVLATGLKGNGPIILYGSADLLNWQPISTNAPASGSATFEAPCTANQRCGFYRIQEE
jgi:sucrose-6-phosphate hydrolase SacC (GH32 family)